METSNCEYYPRSSYPHNTETKMLGSPNSYISKATFADSRSKETYSSTLVNGTVEVFNNSALSPLD